MLSTVQLLLVANTAIFVAAKVQTKAMAFAFSTAF